MQWLWDAAGQACVEPHPQESSPRQEMGLFQDARHVDPVPMDSLDDTVRCAVKHGLPVDLSIDDGVPDAKTRIDSHNRHNKEVG